MGGGGGGGGFRGTRGGKPRRQNGKTPMNNRAQNRQTDAIAKQLKLTPQQARRLHDEVSGQGWDYQEILEYAKDLLKKR